VFAVAPYASRGLDKLHATVVRAAPGGEVPAVEGLAEDAALALDGGGVILVGERLATTPGGLSAAAALADRTGAALVWVPRRAGDRGALDAGCLGSLLPGGRPVADAAARVDVGAVWGSDVPATGWRDAFGILSGAADGTLGGLVLAGVELDDFADPALALGAVERAGFVVSLELREGPVTRLADVVLPVAPVAEKSGSFVTWEGRVRPFPKVLTGSNAVPDVRALAGIATELGRPLGFQTPEGAARELAELGPWDGARVQDPLAADVPAADPAAGGFRLATWKTLVGDGPMQDGDTAYRASGPTPVALLAPAALAALGVRVGEPVELRSPLGAVQLPAGVADLDDDVVWAPTASGGVNLARDLGVGAGGHVTVTRAVAHQGVEVQR
jgi:NADH-quinone oxidoreductase subunit G